VCRGYRAGRTLLASDPSHSPARARADDKGDDNRAHLRHLPVPHLEAADEDEGVAH